MRQPSTKSGATRLSKDRTVASGGCAKGRVATRTSTPSSPKTSCRASSRVAATCIGRATSSSGRVYIPRTCAASAQVPGASRVKRLPREAAAAGSAQTYERNGREGGARERGGGGPCRVWSS